MQAGKRNRRIIIETATETRTSTGGSTPAWATLDEVWAEVKPMTGREYFRAGQTTATFDTLFTILYRSDVTEEMRISYNGQVYNIRGVNEVGYKEELEIMAQVVRA